MAVIATEIPSGRRLARLGTGLALLILVASGSASGDSNFDAGALRGVLESRGFTPTQREAALAMVERANARGLPASALANRIREGIARRAEPTAILGVLAGRLSNLERADDITRRCAKEGINVRDRERSLMRLADSFSMGVTPGDVVTVLSAASRAGRDLESVSRAAEVMGRLGHKGFPPADTRVVLAAATAAGWSRAQMDGLVDVFLEARRFGVTRENMRQILADGIREKKEPAGLVEDMKQSASSESSSHSSAQSGSSSPASSGSSSSGSAKGGKGSSTSHGPGSGAKSTPPHSTAPQAHPHR